MPNRKPTKAIKEAVVLRIRQVVKSLDEQQRYTPEERLALATIEQAVRDIGERETHWDRGADENPDSTAAWLDGRMISYCMAARLEIDWVLKLLHGVELL